MTARSLRVGVVGVGGIGRTHLRAFAAAGTPAVAVTDVDIQRAEAGAKEFGAVAYESLDAMLAEADLDAVSVCTPPVAHPSATVRALESNVAVLCEKPMAISSADCAHMIKAAEASGTILTVGFCHRFQPQVEAMRAAAQAGAIGTVLTFRNRFAGHLKDVEHSWFADPDVAGGGVLMDTCVHSVDLFRYLVGDIADVRAVAGTTASTLGPALQVEDTAILTTRSTNGVLGVIEASWRTRPGEASITLHGTDGTLQLDYQTLTLTKVPADGSEAEVIAVDDQDRFTRQARHFLDCVMGKAEPRVTAQDGATATAILETAYRSAEWHGRS